VAILGAAPSDGSDKQVDPKAARKELPWVLSSNFAEGFPYSIVHQVSSQFFVSMGVSASAVGLTAAYGWAWNLKFFSAPLVERFLKPRHWAVIFQLLIALTLLAASAVTAQPLGVIAALFLVVGIFSAAQDVAVDAHYIASLDSKTQTALSGVRVAAFRVAMMAAGGGIVMLSGWLGFQVGFALSALVMVLLAAFHLRALFTGRDRRATEDGAPAPARRATEIETLRTFIAKPRVLSTIAFLVLYRAGDALMFAMNAPFLKSLGFDTTMRGLVQGTFGGILSVLGAMLGALVISRRGLERTLFPIAVLQSVAILAYVAVAAILPILPVTIGIVLFEQFAAGIGTAALTVFILRLARGAHNATHYALATGLMSIATTVLGLGSGFLLEATGYPLYFSIAFAASVPGVAFALRVRHVYPDLPR